eukprot:CAMPEP_0170361872 /NCGR_PEP_ID=MMETSP0117_2-20130122/4033_1 /TAXON_ID=400756 /ORGANISM="Durinskia baltica, Strain CSIRO CS-38" /LENGTH=68 /DNA_ID=CAMNT_0010616257 /DNA_START=94 /DNA_END=297 /DNA_ORIENTATION=+
MQAPAVPERRSMRFDSGDLCVELPGRLPSLVAAAPVMAPHDATARALANANGPMRRRRERRNKEHRAS